MSFIQDYRPGKAVTLRGVCNSALIERKRMTNIPALKSAPKAMDLIQRIQRCGNYGGAPAPG